MTDGIDCNETKSRAIGAICHSLGGVAGLLGGYSEIFRSILSDDIKYNDSEILDLIISAQSAKQQCLRMINSFRDIVQSVSRDALLYPFGIRPV